MNEPQIIRVIQGATRPIWTVTIYQANNSPLDITGAAFTGVLWNTKRATTLTLTVGSYAVSDGANGVFTYSPVAADVAVPGLWEWETTLTISSQKHIPPLILVAIAPKRGTV